jgi:uncharacterized protein (DUF983 family)
MFNCPSCTAPLSFWAFIKAPTPFHLRCGKCNQLLRLRQRVVSGAVIFISLVAATIAAMLGVFYDLQAMHLFIYLLILVGSFEFLIFSLLRKFCPELELRNKFH